MLINARTPGLRALRQLFPRKPPVHGNPALTAGGAAATPPAHPDRLRAVFEAAGPIESDDVFRALCGGIEYLRNISAHHALDRQNDLPPQQEVALYRDLALAIEALGIMGDPPRVREQMHEHLVAAIEAAEGADIDADLWLREWFGQLIRGAAAIRAAASQIEHGLASSELKWVPGKAPVYPPKLLENIEAIWGRVLGRSSDRPGMSVNVMTRRAGGPFIRFAVACLGLLSLPVNPTAVRAAILRDRARRAQRSG